ncbi:MAG: hypothetical protein WBW84_17385 [Acidobacteriaceae bacterium]
MVLHLTDGEIATAKIAFVDAEYEDIIVDIIDTNRPQQYKQSIRLAAFTIKASDLASVSEISN